MWKVIFGAIVILGLFISILFLTPKEFSCSKDSDCVAASCCHPIACVNKNYAPNCTAVVCSLECKPGTMDCGQGYCACVDRKCTAIIGS